MEIDGEVLHMSLEIYVLEVGTDIQRKAIGYRSMGYVLILN